ncbi:hypothetical protein ACP0HM_05290 [Escherichia coli]
MWHDGKLRPCDRNISRLNTPRVNFRPMARSVRCNIRARRPVFELTLSGGEKLLVSQANMTGEELPATLTPGQQVMVSGRVM